ncbi:hypothetical protein CBL_09576 [Carabus blaptoides fortunei]
MSFNIDCESVSYKNAQRNFYNWTSKWFQSEQKETTLEPDVIEMVTLLQTLGFKICFFDFNDPNDVSLLQNGKRGLKVNIICGNSGLRCCLELGADCRCPKNTTDVTKWEVSGTEPNSSKDEIKEIGSDLFLPVAKGVKTVISTVLNHFLHIVNENTNDCNQNEVKTPTRQTARCSKFDTPNAIEQNLYNQITDNSSNYTKTNVNVIAINPTINMNSTEQPMSPHRYRSLDTLTGCAVLEIPEPGLLKKDTPSKDSLPVLTSSSPNLSGPSHPSSTSSPVNNPAAKRLVCSKLKIIQDLVKDVLNLVDTDRIPSPLLALNISKIKSSAESLPVIEMPKKLTLPIERQSSRAGSSPNLPNTAKTKSAKPMCRPPIRSTTSSAKTTPMLTSTKPTTSGNKALENISPASGRMSLGASTKKALNLNIATVKSNKYSHVKSTIPKTSARK